MNFFFQHPTSSQFSFDFKLVISRFFVTRTATNFLNFVFRSTVFGNSPILFSTIFPLPFSLFQTVLRTLFKADSSIRFAN
jgi:hypothetical protein